MVSRQFQDQEKHHIKFQVEPVRPELRSPIEGMSPGPPEIHVFQVYFGSGSVSWPASRSMLSPHAPLKAVFQSKRNEPSIQARPQRKLDKGDAIAQAGMCPRWWPLGLSSNSATA